MRKNKLVAIILLAASIIALSYYLFSAKRFQFDFSGGNMIARVGNEPYEDGVDGVQTYSSNIGGVTPVEVFVIQTGPARTVWISFSSARWVNGSLGNVSSRYPSNQYSVDITISAVPYKMNVGEHQSPFITIFSHNPEIIFDIVTSYSPDIVSELYNQNHVNLVRESQDRWILDVDAWFEMRIPMSLNTPMYYVKISFTMILQNVPSYKLTG